MINEHMKIITGTQNSRNGRINCKPFPNLKLTPMKSLYKRFTTPAMTSAK